MTNDTVIKMKLPIWLRDYFKEKARTEFRTMQGLIRMILLNYSEKNIIEVPGIMKITKKKGKKIIIRQEDVFKPVD